MHFQPPPDISGSSTQPSLPGVCAPRPWMLRRAIAPRIKKLALITLQIVALLLISEASHGLVGALQWPVPGNLLGMLILVALLTSGVVRLEWVEAGASPLRRHLAFFFIPIAVGLMEFRDLFVRHGVTIVVTLMVGAAIGIWVAGLTSQMLARRRGGDTYIMKWLLILFGIGRTVAIYTLSRALAKR
jgi:holin-like protein